MLNGIGSLFVNGPAAGSRSRTDGPLGPGQAAVGFERRWMKAGAPQFGGSLAGTGENRTPTLVQPPGPLAGAMSLEGLPAKAGGGESLKSEAPLASERQRSAFEVQRAGRV